MNAVGAAMFVGIMGIFALVGAFFATAGEPVIALIAGIVAFIAGISAVQSLSD